MTWRGALIFIRRGDSTICSALQVASARRRAASNKFISVADWILALKIRSWQKFYDSLDIGIMGGSISRAIGIWRPTENDIREFESTYKILLPKSYRDFVLVFGAGQLAKDVEIAAPGYPDQRSIYNLAFRNSCRENEETLLYWPDDERNRLRRFVYFGRYAEQSDVAWDPEDVRNKRAHEYGIWEQRRDLSFHLLGSSFKQCVENLCEPLFAYDQDPNIRSSTPWKSFRHA